MASSPSKVYSTFDFLRQLSFGLLIAVLLVAPLPLGSNHDWAWGPLAAAVGLIVVLQAVGEWGQPRSAIPQGSLAVAGLALAATVGWALLQRHTAILEPWANPIVVHAYEELGLPRASRIALHADDVDASFVMRWLTYAAVFWIVGRLARDSARARALLMVVAVSGVVITCYGLLVEIAERLRGEFAAAFPRLGFDFSGTFVNRNHYAAFVGVCALAVVAAMRLDTPRIQQEPLRLKVRRLALRLAGRTGIHAAALVILLGGLVFSNSKGAMVAFLSGIVTFSVLGRRRSALIFTVVLVLAGLVLALPGGEFLLLRFGWLLNLGEGDRLSLYQLTLHGISLRPWTGWGLGSFDSIYLLLQPAAEPAFYDRAHNTYLELMLELGIPFGLILPLCVLWIAGRCAIGVRERARNQEFPALAVAATVLVGVQSLVDFSLQIPAVAVLYAAILGIGWAQSWSTRRADRTSKAAAQPA